jgi:hypothetical protein
MRFLAFFSSDQISASVVRSSHGQAGWAARVPGRKGTRLAGARVDRVRSVPRTRVKMAGKGTLAES